MPEAEFVSAFWAVLQKQQLVGAFGLSLLYALVILATQTDRHLRFMVWRAVGLMLLGVILVGLAGVATPYTKPTWTDALSYAAFAALIAGYAATLYGVLSLLKSGLIAFAGFPKRSTSAKALDQQVLAALVEGEGRGQHLTFWALYQHLQVDAGEQHDALKRLTKKGWVKPERKDGQPIWPVTDAGRAALQQEAPQSGTNRGTA